jgi:anti-repressor protein
MNESQIIKFKNDNLGEIQGFLKEGEPWFLASHVCKILGIKNHRDALSSIRKKRNDYGIKGVVSTDTLIKTPSGSQKTLIIPEKVLYELIFQCRKKVAYLFQTWVYV